MEGKMEEENKKLIMKEAQAVKVGAQVTSMPAPLPVEKPQVRQESGSSQVWKVFNLS